MRLSKATLTIGTRMALTLFSTFVGYELIELNAAPLPADIEQATPRETFAWVDFDGGVKINWDATVRMAANADPARCGDRTIARLMLAIRDGTYGELAGR